MILRIPASFFLALLTLGPATLVGCAGERAEDTEATDQSFSSREAVQLDFELDGSLVTDSSFSVRSKIQDQFLYTIGHLNGDRSVGRLDKLGLTNVQTTSQGDGTYLVTYHAKLPVAWGKRASVPASYSFTLPRVVSYQGLESFTTKYKASCVDFSAHDVTSGSMWYYYRPKRSGCALEPSEIVTVTATVASSSQNTTGKFPEYHKVWEDDALRVVAIFGKNEDGATSADAGIDAFNSFVASMRSTLSVYNPTTVPPNVGSNPGVANPDVTFRAELADGKTVDVTALLVDNVRTAGPAFDARYNQLSTNADVIIYNGHAGLGQNVRALAQKGAFVSGKYLMLFMNGCDTFAYVDGSLAQKRAPLNPDDNADGTKYMDIVTNGMPSYFHSNARASTALVKGLLSIQQPKTFEQMFSELDPAQVVLVTGEEDNVFQPGMPIGSGGGGGGGGYTRNESGSVTKGQAIDYETPELPAGKYTITIAHDPAAPGGDADLYVKVGAPPTTTSYECRPYKNGSAEECGVTLTAPSKIHVKVLGYANQANAYLLAIRSVAAPPPGGWTGMNESGAVAKDEEKRYETPELPPGIYTFQLEGTGDADLYVKRSGAPTTSSYDCRPYIGGSSERCQITLTASSAIHVMVRGYAAQSTFTLAASP